MFGERTRVRGTWHVTLREPGMRPCVLFDMNVFITVVVLISETLCAMYLNTQTASTEIYKRTENENIGTKRNFYNHPIEDSTNLPRAGSSNLVGSIPPQIGNITLLQRLVLTANKFHGTIPQEIGRLSRLMFLHLGSNSLSGPIPTSLSNCSNLLEVYLSDNLLTGKIPQELVTSLPLIISLSLSNNSLTGELNYLSNYSSVQQIDLSHNKLSGEIPLEIGNFFFLQQLQLDGNSFTGEIPRISVRKFSEVFLGASMLHTSIGLVLVVADRLNKIHDSLIHTQLPKAVILVSALSPARNQPSLPPSPTSIRNTTVTADIWLGNFVKQLAGILGTIDFKESTGFR
ncbi:hypothetical protein LguiA_020873 [Lonicera macranthoides]